MEPIDQSPTQPLHYAALNATWTVLTAGLLVASREDAPPVSELPVYGLAAFTLTKALAKEKVGVWMRDPLVHEAEDGRPPKGRGLRAALGELVTCTRCLGTWSSLGLVGLRVVAPREGHIVATILASAAINDWLQTGFTLAREKANAQEKLAGATLDQWPEAVAAGR